MTKESKPIHNEEDAVLSTMIDALESGKLTQEEVDRFLEAYASYRKKIQKNNAEVAYNAAITLNVIQQVFEHGTLDAVETGTLQGGVGALQEEAGASVNFELHPSHEHAIEQAKKESGLIVFPGTFILSRGVKFFDAPVRPEQIEKLKKKDTLSEREVRRLQKEKQRLLSFYREWGFSDINGQSITRSRNWISSDWAEQVHIENPIGRIGPHPYNDHQTSPWVECMLEWIVVSYAGGWSGPGISGRAKRKQYINMELEMEKGTARFTPSGAPFVVERVAGGDLIHQESRMVVQDQLRTKTSIVFPPRKQKK